MALKIKDRETEQLAAEVAASTGESKARGVTGVPKDRSPTSRVVTLDKNDLDGHAGQLARSRLETCSPE